MSEWTVISEGDPNCEHEIVQAQTFLTRPSTTRRVCQDCGRTVERSQEADQITWPEDRRSGPRMPAISARDRAKARQAAAKQYSDAKKKRR